MKRYTSIAMLVSCSLLTACSINATNEGAKSAPVSTQHSTEQTTEVSTPAPSPVSVEKAAITPVQPIEIRYDLSTEAYSNNGIKINYPKVSGLKDAAKQTSINDTIKKCALYAVDLYKDADNEVNVNINYDVKLQSDRMLSIAYSGIGYVKTAAHPNQIYYTTNLDLPTGKLVMLQDAMNIDENFVKKLRKGEYIGHEGKENPALKAAVLDWMSRPTDQELLDQLKKADLTEVYDPKELPKSFSYCTKDALGISIGVPHPIGDHAEFELKNEEIAANKIK